MTPQMSRSLRRVGCLVGAAWLAALAGCQSRAGAADAHQGSRTMASPRPSIVLPKPDGASNVSDVPILVKAPGRRHVIIMIGDGMQLAHEVAASRYLYGVDKGLAFHGFPERTFKTTWDVTVYNLRAGALTAPYAPATFDPVVGYDPAIGGAKPYPELEDNELRRNYFIGTPGIYPDSASTATAMSTGVKTYSAAIAWRPDAGDQGAMETSPQLLRRIYGMSIGFVTTVPFSHATPAGFFAHNVGRFNYTEIAHELLTSVRPDVMIGGAWENYGYYDAADLDQLVATNAYEFVHQTDGVDGNQAVLAAAVRANQSGKRLLGIFGAGPGGNFPSPVPEDSPGNPKIERGSLESPSLENASIAALEVLSRDPEGFFLLIEQGDIDWSNHANDFARMVGCVSDLDAAVRGVVAFVDRPGDAVDWTNTTLIVTADHANSYMRFEHSLFQGDLPRQEVSSYPDNEITYGVGTHTSELIAVYAKGLVASKLHDYESVYPGLGIIDDTSIYRLTLEAARR